MGEMGDQAGTKVMGDLAALVKKLHQLLGDSTGLNVDVRGRNKGASMVINGGGGNGSCPPNSGSGCGCLNIYINSNTQGACNSVLLGGEIQMSNPYASSCSISLPDDHDAYPTARLIEENKDFAMSGRDGRIVINVNMDKKNAINPFNHFGSCLLVINLLLSFCLLLVYIVQRRSLIQMFM